MRSQKGIILSLSQTCALAHQVINSQQQSLYTAVAVTLPAGSVVQVHPDQLR